MRRAWQQKPVRPQPPDWALPAEVRPAQALPAEELPVEVLTVLRLQASQLPTETCLQLACRLRPTHLPRACLNLHPQIQETLAFSWAGLWVRRSLFYPYCLTGRRLQLFAQRRQCREHGIVGGIAGLKHPRKPCPGGRRGHPGPGGHENALTSPGLPRSIEQ